MMNQLTIAAQQIKDSISAQDVGMALGLEMRHGRCRCPLHGGNDFNCVLYKGNRGFYCHVCKHGGDIIRFVQEYHDMSFKDAVAWFNGTFGLGLDIDSPMDEKRLEEAMEAQRKRAEKARFETALKEARESREMVAMEMLFKLEDKLEAAAPMRPEDEVFNKAFREAAEMIPAMKGIIEDMKVEAMR